MLKTLIFVALVASCVADLRMASQPKNEWKALDRNRNVPFVPKGKKFALYMEPSDFNYAGLKAQRNGGGYDNFLRSNIDNQQDRRNFKTEPGMDHLPFRSYETAANDVSATVQRKLPTVAPGPAIRATPGKPYLVPLRWNNPHAAELEVNIWIMKRVLLPGVTPKPVVVSIRKPTCSAEGHQDNVFPFTIPQDFLQLGSKVMGFTGCKAVGDCVLQIYAHSVESRTYAMGTPLIVEGTWPAPTSLSEVTILNARKDVGVDKAGYQALRAICRPSNDPGADIPQSVPKWPRLISDVFNHAYQNSDFSPYSGQQPDQISQNLQASAILKMTVGNRGELGKNHFNKVNKVGAQLAKKLDKKARELIRVYESITNQIIGAIGHNMTTEDTTLPESQKTDNGFRCAETGAVNARRLTTNTYVPSFIIPKLLVNTALQYVAPIYQHLITKDSITGGATLQIYNAVLADMNDEFIAAGKIGVNYLGTMLKDTVTTKADPVNFIKKDASGKADNGEYAATQAQAEIQKNRAANIVSDVVPAGLSTLALDVTQSSLRNLLINAEMAFIASLNPDPNGVMSDSLCDNDKTLTEATQEAGCEIPGTQYPKPGQLFPDEGQIVAGTVIATSSASSTFSVSCLAAVTVMLAVFAN